MFRCTITFRMLSMKYSINIDPNEPRTFWKIPVTFAIGVFQISIFLLFVGLAIGYEQPMLLIFSVAQVLISALFLLNFVHFILVHLAFQFLGLYYLAALFVFTLYELSRPPSEPHRIEHRSGYLNSISIIGSTPPRNTAAEMWIIWLILTAYVYYLNIVVQHVQYLWNQREKAATQPLPTVPRDEVVKLLSNNSV